MVIRNKFSIYTLFLLLLFVFQMNTAFGQASCIPGSVGCPSGYSCQPTYGGHGVCVDTTDTTNTANGSCGPGKPTCPSQYHCSSSDGNGTCVQNVDATDLGEGASCTKRGCGDPVCGAGYACNEGVCEPNSSCVPGVIQVPYTGPKIDSFGDLVGRIYNVLFPIALLVGVLMIIKGGYEIMTSEGNPQLAKVGQEDLTSAIIGTLFIVMSGMILRMIIVQILGGSVAF
jgi:hypothetical protein